MDLWTAHRVVGFCRKSQIDILHSHSGHALAIGVWANILGASAKHVDSRRVLYPIKKNAFSHLKFNHPSVRRIACVSNSVREVMATGVRYPDRCVTVHSGVDVGRFAQTKETGSLRQEFEVPKDCPIITNVSALTQEKDCLTFVRTAEKVLKTGGRAIFFLVGEGQERQTIETKIRQKGLEKDIVLTGFRRDIPKILAETDLFLMTWEVASWTPSPIACLSWPPHQAAFPKWSVTEKRGCWHPLATAMSWRSMFCPRWAMEPKGNGLANKQELFSKRNSLRRPWWRRRLPCTGRLVASRFLPI